MSQTVALIAPEDVPRSRYVRLRSLLVIACIAIVGLSIAVRVLASSNSVTQRAINSATAGNTSAQTADTGARLDHRGLHDAGYLLGVAAEVGARLDHRG
jgi:hypothetical protein